MDNPSDGEQEIEADTVNEALTKFEAMREYHSRTVAIDGIMRKDIYVDL